MLPEPQRDFVEPIEDEIVPIGADERANVSITLCFVDRDAHTATYVATRTIKANYRGLTRFWATAIRPEEGSLENLLVDDGLPDSLESQFRQVWIAKRFPSSLAKGEVRTVKISCDLIDAFPGNPESYVYTVVTKTERLLIRIEFHPERPYTSSQVYSQYGAEPSRLIEHPQLKRTADKRVLEFVEVSPEVGKSYTLEWNW
jgi:hypothetical protein